MTRKDEKGDQPSGGETTWPNTGATRYGRGQPNTGHITSNVFPVHDVLNEKGLIRGLCSVFTV